jgi:Raf kinase inhibitor-like YbhB/YbcL family protein
MGFIVGIFLFAFGIGGMEEVRAMEIKSSVFKAQEKIPSKYTCDGADVSPPLSWADVPEKTQSLALISDDPDAPVGTWVHWVIYDLPADTRELPEGVAKKETLENGAKQGTNDFRRIGYGGPCPPHGPAHRYFFKLYALDTKLGLPPRATKKDVEKAMKGHILGQAELIGLYKR